MEIKVPMRVSEMLKTTVENRHREKLGTIQDFMVGADGRLNTPSCLTEVSWE